MPQTPSANDNSHPRLILVRQLWRELQASRNDPAKYRGLSERIRRESDRLRQGDDPHERES